MPLDSVSQMIYKLIDWRNGEEHGRKNEQIFSPVREKEKKPVFQKNTRKKNTTEEEEYVMKERTSYL